MLLLWSLRRREDLGRCAAPHQRCTGHQPCCVCLSTAPRVCFGVAYSMCRCLASAGIFVCLDVLWAIITISAVVGLGAASDCAGTGACDGLDDYESDIETAQTGMLIAAIIAFIRLCVDIFGCRAVKNYNAANTGHYWKITLLFALLGLIGPLMSSASEYAGPLVVQAIVVLLLNLWWVFAIRAVATQLGDGTLKDPQMPQDPVSAAAAVTMPTPAPMAYTPAVVPPQQLVPMAITAPAAAPTSSLDLELQQLKLPELRKRAAAAGVSHDAIEEARDSDEPKPAIIVLIKATAARNAAKQRAQAAELQQLKLPELRKRAAAAGVDPDALEEARDSDEPKQAIIGLILAKRAEP